MAWLRITGAKMEEDHRVLPVKCQPEIANPLSQSGHLALLCRSPLQVDHANTTQGQEPSERGLIVTEDFVKVCWGDAQCRVPIITPWNEEAAERSLLTYVELFISGFSLSRIKAGCATQEHEAFYSNSLCAITAPLNKQMLYSESRSALQQSILSDVTLLFRPSLSACWYKPELASSWLRDCRLHRQFYITCRYLEVFALSEGGQPNKLGGKGPHHKTFWAACPPVGSSGGWTSPCKSSHFFPLRSFPPPPPSSNKRRKNSKNESEPVDFSWWKKTRISQMCSCNQI